jgi:hypothetical protein
MKELRLFAGVVGGLAIAVVVSIGVYNSVSNHNASVAWSNQKWGEIADAPKVVVLKPGQWMRLGPFAPTVGGSLHYDVNSSLPIKTGLVQPGGSWPGSASCFESQVLASSKSCGVTPNSQQYIFIADTRTPGEILGGVLLGNHAVAIDNRVAVNTYHWGCVINFVK